MFKKWWLLVSLLLSLSNAGGQTGPDFMTNAEKGALGSPALSLDPDNYEGLYSRFGKLAHIKGGGEIGVFAYETAEFSVGATFGGFLEIRDYNTDIKYRKFGLWRGHFGAATHWSFKSFNQLLGVQNKVVFSLGWEDRKSVV